MTPLPAAAPRQRGRSLAPWLVMTTLAGLGGCSRAGGIGVAERDAGHPSGLGARPETFGVSGGDSPGSRRWASGFEVRWEPVGKVPRVVGIAELWGGPGRPALPADGLRPAADTYARRWGATDAAFVARTELGGVEVFQYRSASLRSSLRSSPDPAARAGEFLVAVTLATGPAAAPDRPIAADTTDPRRVPEGTFSIAVLAGNPWP